MLLHMLKDERLVPHQLTQYSTLEELSIGKIQFKVFGLGGHQIARGVWKVYYAKVDAVVYLVDAYDKERFAESKKELDALLSDEVLADVPFLMSTSSSQNSHLVSKATCLWESLLARNSQYEVLTSSPIEDLIAHMEHRYRISGSSLLAAMDQSSQIPHTDVLTVQSSDLASGHLDGREQTDESYVNVTRDRQKNRLDSSQSQVNDDTLRVDDRSGRVHPTVDIAESIRL